MDKLKVYLSRSRAGSKEDLVKARSFLDKYDIDVLEYNEGKNYTNTKLLSSDIVIILPPELPSPYTFDFTLGKGQFNEYCEASDEGITVYFVICLGNKMYLSTLEELEILDINWQIKFAHIYCENNMKSLKSMKKEIKLKDQYKSKIFPDLENPVEELERKSSTTTKPMLACIKYLNI